MIGLKFWTMEDNLISSYWISRKHFQLLKGKQFGYGIDGKTLKWIDSFLWNRQQYMVVNGAKSDCALFFSGVPQGTVLSPLLFSLCINDISTDIDSEI